MYPDRDRFRSRIVMERHNYGVGEYKYFARPMPPLVEDLRVAMYRKLAPTANRWAERMRSTDSYPSSLAEFLKVCADSLTDQADAADSSLRERRLQLPASGSVRRGRVPASVHLRTEPARTRLRRRRTIAGRAAPAGAIARRGDRARCRRGNNLRESLPSRGRRKGIPSREHASRRQHDQIRRALRDGRHLSRRRMSEPAYRWSSAAHLPSMHAQVAPSLSLRYCPQKSSQAVRLSSVP